MSSKYKFRNHEGIYFASFATVYWIDVFIRNTYKDILVDSWKYCQKEKGLNIYAWVIMTSHVHMIIGSQTNHLDAIMRDMKSFTSRKLKEAITENIEESRREWMLWMMARSGIKNGNNNGFRFWQQNNHPIELSDNTMMDQKLDYIHNNPVIAGFVEKPEEYIYSSARDYCGIKGLVDIERLC